MDADGRAREVGTVTVLFTDLAGSTAMRGRLSEEAADRRGLTEAMRVRVGISTGDVTFEGGDCFGLPVVEAQRLEASAEPGTIRRCAEMIKLLARCRCGHEFVSLGELTLKGLAEPLAACEVRWTAARRRSHSDRRAGPAAGVRSCGRSAVLRAR